MEQPNIKMKKIEGGDHEIRIGDFSGANNIQLMAVVAECMEQMQMIRDILTKKGLITKKDFEEAVKRREKIINELMKKHKGEIEEHINDTIKQHKKENEERSNYIG